MQKNKKINIKAYREIVVDFFYPKMDVIVIISHGFLKTKDSALIQLLAKGFHERGLGVVIFNFNTYITLENWFLDLSSIIHHFKNKYKIVLVGHSLGGLISFMAYEQSVKAIIGLAPVSKPKKPTFLNNKVLKEQLDRDQIIEFNIKGITFRVPKQYVKERLDFNKDNVFSQINCPVLILHGDKDNIISLDDSREAVKLLPPYSKLIILEGADHSFKGYEGFIVDFSMQWLMNVIF